VAPPLDVGPPLGTIADTHGGAPPLPEDPSPARREPEPPVGRATAATEPAAASQPDATPVSLRSHAAADEDLIRATLGRYADAYARLDAQAAQQVWPTVDARALQRAFEGLESQGLAFDRCELRVVDSDATAACRGRASYVPKVGRREPLSVSRLWVFTLRRGEAGWAITSADAR